MCAASEHVLPQGSALPRGPVFLQESASPGRSVFLRGFALPQEFGESQGPFELSRALGVSASCGFGL